MSNKKLVIILIIGIIVVVILSLFFIFWGEVSPSLGFDYSAGAGALDSMSKSGNVFEDLKLNPFGGE